MSGTAVHGQTVLWEPGADAASGPLGRFLAQSARERGVDLPDYRAALDWSTTDLAGFWDGLRRFFDVPGEWGRDPLAAGRVLIDDRMPGAVWFPDARVNYAEQLLRHAAGPGPDRAAIVDIGEDGERRETSWRELAAQVGTVAASFRRLGVTAGDRVAAVLPNVPETIVALLATASLGAVWSVCSPDLAAPATIARLAQLEPKILLASVGYRFGGTWFDRRDHLSRVRAALPSVEHVIEVGDGADGFAQLLAEPADPVFERVPFDHPLWVLFTSGTTGTPKGIVHGHGGMLLEGLKLFGLMNEMDADDRFYVAANTSWMVWNLLVDTMLTGASIVTYSGSPAYPRLDRQFEIVARTGVTVFGTGAAYLKLVQDAGLQPGSEHDLSRLRVAITTGSTLADATSLWLHRQTPPGFRLCDSSGGTDICSGFVGGNPLEPVRLGRMQGALLGVAADVYDEAGRSVRDHVGELVITRPLPAMPVRFWGDPDGSRYRAAYFEDFPDVWTHGDWMTEGADGTVEILGRSDATLNRGGVRLGSSEIYGALQGLPGVRDSMVLGIEVLGGGYWMPLFVVLDGTRDLDDALVGDIRSSIRAQASARHVPDEVIAVAAIPLTHSGKKVEIPVKRLFLGADPATIDRGSLANPEALDWFADRAAQFRADQHEGASR
jgi:acetoacetyl-CoA synthetase